MATDADDPTTANGELRYSLTHAGDTSAFDIDSTTGGFHMTVTLQERSSSFIHSVDVHDIYEPDLTLTDLVLSCRFDQLQDKQTGPGNQE